MTKEQWKSIYNRLETIHAKVGEESSPEATQFCNRLARAMNIAHEQTMKKVK